MATRKRRRRPRRCTAGGWWPNGSRPTASRSCSRSRAGHLFSIFDGCREEGIDIVDVRHEQSAAFAAEGWAKATRQVGVCAVTAGPGVTNAMSALGLGAAERLAAGGARRPRAGHALGAGLAAGDRPRAVRGAAHALRRHGRLHRARSPSCSTPRWRPPWARRRGRRSWTSRSTWSSRRPTWTPTPRRRSPTRSTRPPPTAPSARSSCCAAPSAR